MRFQLTKAQKEKLKKVYSETKEELGEIMGSVEKGSNEVHKVTSRMAHSVQGSLVPQTRRVNPQFQRRRRFQGMGFDM